MVKRIIGTVLLLSAFCAHADNQMPVSQTGSTAYVTHRADTAALQGTYTPGSAAHAKDFLQRLNATVKRGHALAQSGNMDVVQQSEHTLALNKLKEESETFSALAHPFSECNDAALDAMASWQGLIKKNDESFTNNHMGYVGSANECLKAAS